MRKRTQSLGVKNVVIGFHWEIPEL